MMLSESNYNMNSLKNNFLRVTLFQSIPIQFTPLEALMYLLSKKAHQPATCQSKLFNKETYIKISTENAIL